MDNRRQNYRHTFPDDSVLPVAVQRGNAGPFCPGYALDLSVTGMRVRLEDPANRLSVGDRVSLRFSLPLSQERVLMHGEVIHGFQGDQGEGYGVQFLPSLSPSADEQRERVIWQFLLTEQRRALKRTHSEPEV